MPLQLNLIEESDLTQYNLEHNATIPVPSYSSLNRPGVRASNLLCSLQQVRGNQRSGLARVGTYKVLYHDICLV